MRRRCRGWRDGRYRSRRRWSTGVNVGVGVGVGTPTNPTNPNNPSNQGKSECAWHSRNCGKYVRVRTRDIQKDLPTGLGNSGGFDANLVALCKMVRIASR